MELDFFTLLFRAFFVFMVTVMLSAVFGMAVLFKDFI